MVTDATKSSFEILVLRRVLAITANRLEECILWAHKRNRVRLSMNDNLSNIVIAIYRLGVSLKLLIERE